VSATILKVGVTQSVVKKLVVGRARASAWRQEAVLPATASSPMRFLGFDAFVTAGRGG
jgi:hypothetical protein